MPSLEMPGWYLPLILATALGSARLVAQEQSPVPAAAAVVADNAELAQIYTDDQSDRQPKDGQMMDGRVMLERDGKRRTRVLEIYQADGLKTGTDYLHAAMVMQHGGSPEYYLLAHEFCMAALALGNDRARWLSAASHDRFLKSIGRPQRFGTQYGNKIPGGPQELYQVEEGVRDSLRQVLKVPTLAQAKAREAEMTKRYSRPKPTLQLANFSAVQPAPAEFDILDLKAGDTAPEVVEFSQPNYPEELLAEKAYGFVILTGVIERDGTFTQSKVAKASQEYFGPAAEAAVTTWKFKPGTKQGQPARVIVFVQMYFSPPVPK